MMSVNPLVFKEIVSVKCIAVSRQTLRKRERGADTNIPQFCFTCNPQADGTVGVEIRCKDSSPSDLRLAASADEVLNPGLAVA